MYSRQGGDKYITILTIIITCGTQLLNFSSIFVELSCQIFVHTKYSRQHCRTMQHTKKVRGKIAGSQRGVPLLQCITDYKDVVSSQADGQVDGQEPAGFALVPERRQFRSFVQNFGKRCWNKLQKANKTRGSLERRMSSMQLTMTIRNRKCNLQ